MWCAHPASEKTAAAAKAFRTNTWRFMAGSPSWMRMEHAFCARARLPWGWDNPQHHGWASSLFTGFVRLAARSVELPRARLDTRAVGIGPLDCVLVDDRFRACRSLLAHRFAERRLRRVAAV